MSVCVSWLHKTSCFHLFHFFFLNCLKKTTSRLFKSFLLYSHLRGWVLVDIADVFLPFSFQYQTILARFCLWSFGVYFSFVFSGKNTPVSSCGGVDVSKPADPFQPFAGDAVDVFQCKRATGDPFSGKDPFAPTSAPSKRHQSLFLVDGGCVSSLIDKIDEFKAVAASPFSGRSLPSARWKDPSSSPRVEAHERCAACFAFYCCFIFHDRNFIGKTSATYWQHSS